MIKRGAGLVLLMASFAAFGGLGDKKAVIEGWEIYRQVDIMTDEVSCIATYKGKSKIQLDDGALAVGGVVYPEGYQYRIDDQPQSSMQLTSSSEKQVGAVIIEGDLFKEVLKSKRFRIQVIGTALTTFDLDMSAAPAVIAKFKELGCS